MSVTADTFHAPIGPYMLSAAISLVTQASTAVWRLVLSSKPVIAREHQHGRQHGRPGQARFCKYTQKNF